MSDSITVFANPYQRILLNQTARVPIIIGSNQDDGTLFQVGQTDLGGVLNSTFGSLVSVGQVRALYPGQTDTEIISNVIRETLFLW